MFLKCWLTVYANWAFLKPDPVCKVSFITSESVHPQLEQISLRNVFEVLRRISAIVTCLPLPFIHTLWMKFLWTSQIYRCLTLWSMSSLFLL